MPDLPYTQESQSFLKDVFLTWKQYPVLWWSDFSIHWLEKIHNDKYTHKFKQQFTMNF